MTKVIINPNTCVVYWLFDKNCVCLWRHGYVGISEKFESRLKRHKKDKRFPAEFSAMILFRGSRDECLDLEEKLRPTWKMGWNEYKGGRAGASGPKSEETKEKMRAKALERFSDPEARRLLGIAVRKALKDVDRSGSNNANFGNHQSETTKQKVRDKIAERGGVFGENNPNFGKKHPEMGVLLSAKLSGRVMPKEELQMRRDIARRGEQHPMFGRHHSEESRQKNRESQLRIDWSGERNNFFGKTHSDETRKLLSMKAKLRHQNKEK